MTIAETLRAATGALAGASDTPRLDAEVLMAHALGCCRSDLLLRHMNEPAPPGFAALAERRMRSEPVAYITGQQEFFGLVFAVTPDVLIPRGDSEVLVEQALSARPDARRVLDCGTGSGALLLSVLHHLPAARGIGTDRSEAALGVARANARASGLAERAEMHLADWDAPGWTAGLGGPFDLVLANPPYVETDAPVAPDVRDYEPAGALFAGPQGLDAYRALLPQLPPILSPRGVAVVEIGSTQAAAVSALAGDCGLASRLAHDLAGRPRVVVLTCVA